VLSFYGSSGIPVGAATSRRAATSSCSLLGAERLIDHLRRKLGIRPGETTADGASASRRSSAASCGTAPVVVVNGAYHEPMSAEKLDARSSRRKNEVQPQRLLMNFEVTPTSHGLADYRARGGYGALEKALTTMTSQQVTAEVTASGIQGRGGANFSAGRKWSVINLNDGQPHYLCANADEGEPGTFKDRWILEEAPHLLLESMLIAPTRCRCATPSSTSAGGSTSPTGASPGRPEECRQLLTSRFSAGFACDLILSGAGSYVCGRASGLLTRSRPGAAIRNRPPRLRCAASTGVRW
jgi:hypothetical protein